MIVYFYFVIYILIIIYVFFFFNKESLLYNLNEKALSNTFNNSEFFDSKTIILGTCCIIATSIAITYIYKNNQSTQINIETTKKYNDVTNKLEETRLQLEELKNKFTTNFDSSPNVKINTPISNVESIEIKQNVISTNIIKEPRINEGNVCLEKKLLEDEQIKILQEKCENFDIEKFKIEHYKGNILDNLTLENLQNIKTGFENLFDYFLNIINLLQHYRALELKNNVVLEQTDFYQIMLNNSIKQLIQILDISEICGLQTINILFIFMYVLKGSYTNLDLIRLDIVEDMFKVILLTIKKMTIIDEKEGCYIVKNPVIWFYTENNLPLIYFGWLNLFEWPIYQENVFNKLSSEKKNLVNIFFEDFKNRGKESILQYNIGIENFKSKGDKGFDIALDNWFKNKYVHNNIIFTKQEITKYVYINVLLKSTFK